MPGQCCVRGRGRKELSTAWHPRNRKRKAGYQGLQAEAPWTLSLQMREAEQETVNVMRPLSRYSWEMARENLVLGVLN